MVAWIQNRQIGARQTFRPMLGAAQSLSTLQDVKPSSVPPEKVAQIPVSTVEGNTARVTYLLAVKALDTWIISDLKKIQTEAADWDRTVYNLTQFILGRYSQLVEGVRGRTGNSDAEYHLELVYWGLWDDLHQASERRPSGSAQAWAEFLRRLGDFVAGAQQAWQGYVDWATKQATPILRKYHDGLEHLAKLDANLLEAVASGAVSDGEIFNQQQAIARAQEGMDNVEALYKKLSGGGGSLNALAVEEFGPISLGGIVLAPLVAGLIAVLGPYLILAVAAVLVVSILAYTGYKIAERFADGAKEAADNFVKMVKDNPIGTTAAIGFILGMVALPFALFRSKEVIVQQPGIETS